MAAAVADSRASAGKKPKTSLKKKKKKIKTAARAAASGLKDEDGGAADIGGSVPGRAELRLLRGRARPRLQGAT